MGQSLEITINNGVGLPVHFASTTPSSAAPIDADELGVASQLLGEPLKLIRSKQLMSKELLMHNMSLKRKSYLMFEKGKDQLLKLQDIMYREKMTDGSSMSKP